jgi:hypothetical protein
MSSIRLFFKFNNLSAHNYPFSFCQSFFKCKSPLYPHGNSANEYTRFLSARKNFFLHQSHFLNNVFSGRLPVKIKIQKFVSRLLSKSAIGIFAGLQSIKSKIHKFFSNQPAKCAILNFC